MLVVLNSFAKCAQPYFPPQIVFSLDNDKIMYAIDEINQRAFKIVEYPRRGPDKVYAEKNFSYAPYDTPQSRYYVQLLINPPPHGCMYGTFWQYGGSTFNEFPMHWLNETSFEIKNFLQFKYEMIPSVNSSENEDYWYANTTCKTDGGEIYPCEEIYFQKNTDIPLRYAEVTRSVFSIDRVVTNFTVISIAKPDDKYFNSIPEEWFIMCRDVMLDVMYDPWSSKIALNQSANIQVWLRTPPHRIDGNDTVIIDWKPTNCTDCFTWIPQQISFNSENFQTKQILKITRVKNGPNTTFIPTIEGGGFNLVPPDMFPIYIE